MNVFFHIGYPRTGSTFIQKYLFEKHSEINYLGPKYYNYDFKPYLTDNKMLKINNLNVDEEINFENFDSIFSDLKLNKNKINLISSEKFLTYGINYFENLVKIKKLIELQNKNVVFKVFFVIRNQFDAIKSYYHHAFSEISDKFEMKNFNELVDLNNLNKNINNEEMNFFKNYYYDNTFKNLKRYFSKENIKILLYENLNNDKQKFSNDLSKFLMINPLETNNLLDFNRINELKTEKNKISVHKIYFSKLHAFYAKSKLKNVVPQIIKDFIKKIFITKIDYKISDHRKNEFKKFFKESNLILQNDYGIKLPEEYF